MKLKKNIFSRHERLITSYEFKRIKNKNHLCFNQGPIKIYILNQNLKFSRLGIVIYKRVAKAFYRNKIKRWVREIFRCTKSGFQEKMDILVIVGRGKDITSLKLLREAFLSAVHRYDEKENAER